MEAKYYINREGAEAVSKGLIEIFGTKEDNKKIEANYSLGFKRYLKLSHKKAVAVQTVLLIEGFDAADCLAELKSRLEKMSETEFLLFKKT